MEPLTPEELNALCDCGDEKPEGRHKKNCLANYRRCDLESASVPHSILAKTFFTGVVEVFYRDEIKRREWLFEGKLHRLLGPALEYSDFVGYKDRIVCWWYLGSVIQPEILFEKLSDEQKEKALWNFDQWKNYAP